MAKIRFEFTDQNGEKREFEANKDNTIVFKHIGEKAEELALMDCIYFDLSETQEAMMFRHSDNAE